MSSVKIDDFEIPGECGLDYTQSYDRLSPVSTIRMQSGRGVRQGTYSKIKTSIEAQGWIPSGLTELDPTKPHTIYCGTPQAKHSVSPVLTITEKRRTDAGYEPTAYAIVDGLTVSTPYTLVNNVISCTPVAGATAYHVLYYPKFVGFIDPPSESVNVGNATTNWTINIEEM